MDGVETYTVPVQAGRWKLLTRSLYLFTALMAAVNAVEYLSFDRTSGVLLTQLVLAILVSGGLALESRRSKGSVLSLTNNGITERHPKQGERTFEWENITAVERDRGLWRGRRGNLTLTLRGSSPDSSKTVVLWFRDPLVSAQILIERRIIEELDRRRAPDG